MDIVDSFLLYKRPGLSYNANPKVGKLAEWKVTEVRGRWSSIPLATNQRKINFTIKAYLQLLGNLP